MDGRALVLRGPGGVVADLELTAQSSILGRGEDADLHVEEPSVSRRHARIELTTAGWTVADLESTQGTFVDGVRVDEDETVVLEAGGKLRLGRAEFVAQTTGPAFERPAPPTRPEGAPTPQVTRDEFLTRGSLLLRLGDDDTMVRELSWQDFHTQYAPILRGFARKGGCPPDQLDDLVQEVMTNFFCAAERFEYDPARGRFRGYLKTATIRALQSQRHKLRGRVEWEPERFLEQAQSVDDAWDREWMEQLLERAVQRVRSTSRLSASSWDAFELYGRRGMALAAAAQQLGMQPEAVKKAKNRVAALVRDEIERLRLEEG